MSNSNLIGATKREINARCHTFLCWLTLICNLATCSCGSDLQQQLYQEKLLFQGKWGEENGDLAFIKSAIGTLEGPTSLAVSPKGTLWLPDSYNKLLKEFDSTGNVRSALQLDSSSIIDDIACDSYGNLMVRDWSNKTNLISFDLIGNRKQLCALPRGQKAGGCAALLAVRDSNIFVQYMDSSGHMVGLKYNLRGDLIEVRRRDLALWVESGGLYFVASESGYYDRDIGPFKIGMVRNQDGKTFANDIDDSGLWVNVIGVDLLGNLYLTNVIRSQNIADYEYYVIKYGPDGRKLSQFCVQPFDDIADSHFPKVDKQGNVYLITASEDLKEWNLYRYSPTHGEVAPK